MTRHYYEWMNDQDCIRQWISWILIPNCFIHVVLCHVSWLISRVEMFTKDAAISLNTNVHWQLYTCSPLYALLQTTVKIMINKTHVCSQCITHKYYGKTLISLWLLDLFKSSTYNIHKWIYITSLNIIITLFI